MRIAVSQNRQNEDQNASSCSEAGNDLCRCSVHVWQAKHLERVQVHGVIVDVHLVLQEHSLKVATSLTIEKEARALVECVPDLVEAPRQALIRQAVLVNRL